MRLDELLKTQLGKTQYRELAKKFHGDVGGSDEKMKEINNAKDSYNGDEAIAKLYDKYINSDAEPQMKRRVNPDARIIEEIMDYIEEMIMNSFKEVRGGDWRLVAREHGTTWDIGIMINKKIVGTIPGVRPSDLQDEDAIWYYAEEVAAILEEHKPKPTGTPLDTIVAWCKDMEANIPGLKLIVAESQGQPLIMVSFMPKKNIFKRTNIIQFNVMQANKFTSLKDLNDYILNQVEARL